MASNPPGACCAQGFKHEGTPVGEVKNVNGVDYYITYPKDNKTPEKAVLFLSDIFGLFNNAKLLADEYAANGYLCVIPDLFNGDAIPVAEMEAGKFDIGAWFPNHQPANVDPIVEAAVKYVKGDLGVKRLAAVGYCFGAKYVCRFMKEGKVDVGFNAHPSFVTHEELGAITGPLSIAAAEIDTIFTTELRHESEGTLIKTGQPWQINLFSGVSHGFAVRADLSNKHFKWAKEQAFCQAIAWFRQYL
ncbi:dienelactone hydrolase family protein [Aspergillus japonicus CBS 114.51]|uniref:Dienelactone hydrolase family protein n=2 Tax=Aspergillus TaxID=5052 RepID=A0A2V5HAF0_ASPV1|nr:dienelactone hydrolase family protein [Aspergillus japonicus CBS 114.51]PYI21375.1 dienelactone hydrolase family protein [Aspergillus violaceofuscus CBS 115571]RAH84473.1 dienelactone hydrolase family protein [Aspergillus japonicus CBS 114.51]